MKNYVIVAVLAISQKKDKDMGWIRFSTITGRNWRDLGAHFDKAKFGAIFTAPGLYKISYVNNAGLDDQNAKFAVTGAEKVGSFEELIELAENAA